MTSWLKRSQASVPSSVPGSALSPSNASNTGHLHDPNVTDFQLHVDSRCIYERRLPGDAYVSAHVTRLQHGFYDNSNTSGDAIENVRFLAMHFVFHPADTENRFSSAKVRISLRGVESQGRHASLHASAQRLSIDGTQAISKATPKFLRFAPHIAYGSVSPEKLDWNFNLTGSLGVSQAPVSASISPTVGMTSSYKVYHMLRIQGSARTSRDQRFDHGPHYDLEDGEVVWTLAENRLQNSGLPREMTFAVLLTTGDARDVVLNISIEPTLAGWFGRYPRWLFNLLRYQPPARKPLDLDKEIGQCFRPHVPGKGFNFANLMDSFDDFVSLPGTTYSSTSQRTVPPASGSTAAEEKAQTDGESKPG